MFNCLVMKEILKLIPRSKIRLKNLISKVECCDNKILGRRKRNVEIQLERWIQVVRHGGRQAAAGWGLVNKAQSRNAAIETGFTSLVFHQRRPQLVFIKRTKLAVASKLPHTNWNSWRKSNLRKLRQASPLHS